MIQVPQKWNRFSDGILDRHLDEIYNYLRNSASGSDAGTDLDTSKFFVDVSYSGGYLTSETYYTTSARSTKLRDYTYSYSSGILSKIVENLYNLGVKISTNTYVLDYNSDDTVKNITKTVA